jgi:hypothetical protein
MFATIQVRTIIFPRDLCGCETFCRTLREEDRLVMFEKRVLKGILGRRKVK